MLKVWNMVLVLLTFSLTIFGTFLTRSGVISSVHSLHAVGARAVLHRLPAARDPGRRAVWSSTGCRSCARRERARVVLLARGGVPVQQPDPGRHRLRGLLGHGLPGDLGVGARREDHRRAAVLQPGERAARPRAALPHGRRPGDRLAARHAAQPVARPSRARSASALVGGRRAAALGGVPLGGALAHVRRSASSCSATIVQEFWRGMRARQAMLRESAPRALGRLVGKNRRRYGGYVIHIGIVMHVRRHRGVELFRIEVQQTLKPGDEIAGRPLHAALRPHRARRRTATSSSTRGRC